MPGGKGDPGAAGVAKAYLVFDTASPGDIDQSRSSGIGSATATQGNTGYACIAGLPFTPAIAVGNPLLIGGGNGGTSLHIETAQVNILSGCPSGTQIAVGGFNGAGTATTVDFSLLIN